MSQRSKKNQPPENRDLQRQSQNIQLATAVCGFLLLAVVLVFGQTLRHDFVNYDDDSYVYANPQVAHGLTAQGIAWAFTHRYAGNWHPLTWLSHMLDCQIYGLAPWGHHLTNVLLHAATAIFLFLVLMRMTGDFWPSAFVAAVFAVHPLRAESVAWVAERKDVLSGLFFMLTLWTYAGYVRHPFSLARYLAVLAFFALGLMAKPMLVTLPFILLLLDYWPLGRMSQDVLDDRNKSWGGSYTAAPEVTVQLSPQRSFMIFLRLLMEKVPFLVLAAASCAVTFWAQNEGIATNEQISWSLRIGNAAVSYVAYIAQLFYPAGLAVIYLHPGDVLPMWKIAGAFSVLAAICGVVVAWRRRCPYLLVGWFWYAGMLLPVIGLVQVGWQKMADRYTYLPQIGLCMALAWGVADVCRSWPYRGRVCGVASALVLAVLIVCAWRQTSFWRDSQTLWTHTLDCTSQNYVAYNKLGKTLSETGRLQKAIEYIEQALRLKSDYLDAHNNLGNALIQAGRYQEAIEHYEQVLLLRPDNVEVHNNLGIALVQADRPQEAIEHFQQTLRLQPDYPEAHYNLGNILLKTNQLPEAIEHYEHALRLKPDYFEAHNNLGNALCRIGKLSEAIEQYEQVLRFKPDHVEARYNMACILVQQVRLNEAIEHFEQTLRLKPDFPEAHNNLALVLVQTGRPQEAIEHYEQAVRLKPDYIKAYANVALVYAQTNRPVDAVAAAQKALQLARSQGQTALARQIEDWLNSYKTSIGD